jgi:hypothetical protein
MPAGDMTPRRDPRQESSSVPAIQEQRLEANSFAYVVKIDAPVPYVNGKSLHVPPEMPVRVRIFQAGRE